MFDARIDNYVPPYSESFCVSSKSNYVDLFNAIPGRCKKLMYILKHAGYDTYIVGGCVRDFFLNKAPNDWDIATQATPDAVKRILKYHGVNVVDTGIKHGTVTAVINDESYEITTFRVESDYRDGRHPNKVNFVRSIEEDLSRRDFTMNAMAYSYQSGLVDPFGGLNDIRNSVVRCVGVPKDRFKEDHLRILRAVRFCATLGFSVEQNLAKTIHASVPMLASVSSERKWAELVKLFSTDFNSSLYYVTTEFIDVLSEAFLCPELYSMKGYDQHSKYHNRDLFEHSRDVMLTVPRNAELRIAALFHDIGKMRVKTVGEDGFWHYLHHPRISEEIVREMLIKLKCSNATIEHICFLVLNHDSRPATTLKSARKFIARCEKDETKMQELLDLMRADIACHTPESAEEMRMLLDKAVENIEEILKTENCFSIKDLDINGHDLMNIGFEQGPELGRCLQVLFESVIDERVANCNKDLIDYARELIDNV